MLIESVVKKENEELERVAKKTIDTL